MDQVQVQVVDAQVRDGLLNRCRRLVRAVVRVPELARDPDIFAGNVGGGDTLSGFILIRYKRDKYLWAENHSLALICNIL